MLSSYTDVEAVLRFPTAAVVAVLVLLAVVVIVELPVCTAVSLYVDVELLASSKHSPCVVTDKHTHARTHTGLVE